MSDDYYMEIVASVSEFAAQLRDLERTVLEEAPHAKHVAETFRASYEALEVLLSAFVRANGIIKVQLKKIEQLERSKSQCGEVCERAKLCAVCARELKDGK